MTMPATESGWKVTSQRETSAPDPSGNYTEGMVVAFTTRGGVSGSVFVPNSQYNKATVKQMIGERAAVLDDVQSLTSD